MAQMDLRESLAKHLLEGIDAANGKLLGDGSYGVVRTVKYEGKELACKTYRDYLINRADHNMRGAFLKECQNAMRLDHPNVVRSCGFYFPQEAIFPSLVMELLPHCLNKILEQGMVPYHYKPFVLADVANGLSYLHSQNIMHRDLTANNVLLTEKWTAKIADFGQAKVVKNKDFIKHTSAPGTPVYMPPEARPISQGATIPDLQQLEYSYTIDVFSFGVLILHMYLNKIPRIIDETVSDTRNPQLFYRRPPLDYFSQDIETAIPREHPFRSLVERCLKDSPSRRPSASELCIETNDMRQDACRNVGLIIADIEERHKQDQEKIKKYEEQLTDYKKLKNHLTQLSEAYAGFKERAMSRRLIKGQTKGDQPLEPQDTTDDPGLLESMSEKRNSGQMLEESFRSITGRKNTASEPPEVLENMMSYRSEKRRTAQALIDEEDKDDIMISFRDAEIMFEERAKHVEKDLLQARRDHAVLLSDYQQLHEENQRIRADRDRLLAHTDDNPLLQTMTKELPSPGSLSELPSSLDPTKKDRMLLKSNALITIEDVPQQPLSFHDISGAQAVTHGGKVYIGRATCSIWMYDTVTKEWKKMNTDAPFKNYGLAIYDKKLTIVGGSDAVGRLSRKALVYNEDNDTWDPDKIKKEMSRPRENPAVATTDKYLIAMGGTSTRVVGLFLTPVSTIEVYNGNEWSLANASLQRPGDTMQSFVQDGFLYVLNSDGWTARYCSVNTLIESLTSKKKAKNLWHSIPRDVPHTRSCVFVWDHTLLAISGAGSDGLQYAFDPNLLKWNRIKCRGALPAIRNATCLWVGHNKLFLCGGNIDMFTDSSKASFMLLVGEDDGEPSDEPSHQFEGSDITSSSYDIIKKLNTLILIIIIVCFFSDFYLIFSENHFSPTHFALLSHAHLILLTTDKSSCVLAWFAKWTALASTSC